MASSVFANLGGGLTEAGPLTVTGPGATVPVTAIAVGNLAVQAHNNDGVASGSHNVMRLAYGDVAGTLGNGSGLIFGYLADGAADTAGWLRSAGTDQPWAQGVSSTEVLRLTATGLAFGATASTKLLIGVAAPTISSGFGTSPSVVANNGTVGFTINVGTGGSASSGVIALPTATTGWIAHCVDITNAATAVTAQTAGTTSTVTVTNYSRTTGLATAWAASDVLRVTCFAY